MFGMVEPGLKPRCGRPNFLRLLVDARPPATWAPEATLMIPIRISRMHDEANMHISIFHVNHHHWWMDT